MQTQINFYLGFAVTPMFYEPMRWIFSFSVVFLFAIHSLKAWDTPVAVSPANQALVFTSVLIDWNSVPSSTAYQLELDTSALFNSPLRQRIQKNYINPSNTGNDTRHQFTNLFFGQRYFWRLRAWQQSDTSAWTSTRSFNTLGIIPIQSPANAQLNLNQGSVTLDWFAHQGASTYHVQIDTTNLFNSVSLQNIFRTVTDTGSNGNDSRHLLSTGLINRVYFWRVRAMNAVDTSAWHLRWFSTGTANIFVPNPPNQLEPLQGLTEQPTTQTFLWNTSNFANLYEIYIDTVPQLNSPLIYTLSDTSLTVEILQPNRTYYWYVRAFNTSTIVSAWSPLRSFRTLTYIAEPDLIRPAPDEVDVDLNTVFSWRKVPYASHYALRISRHDSLLNPVEWITNDTLLIIDTLQRSTRYSWSVQAFRDTSFSSVAADTIHFRLAALPTPQPILPSNGTELETNHGAFSWSTVDEASFYELRLLYGEDVTHSFSRQSFQTNIEEDSLNWATTYSWQVRAASDSGNSAWSGMRAFSVVNPAALGSIDRSSNNLWPNPVKDYLNFNFSQHVEAITLLRSDGRMVYGAIEEINPRSGRIDIRKLPAGLYWCIVNFENGTRQSSRFIVQ